jgi:hypothetical protein
VSRACDVACVRCERRRCDTCLARVTWHVVLQYMSRACEAARARCACDEIRVLRVWCCTCLAHVMCPV